MLLLCSLPPGYVILQTDRTVASIPLMLEVLMATRTLAFDLPDDFVDHLGSAEELAAQAKQAFVLQLLREVRIS